MPIARRTRLKIDLAGSYASAEIAATASAAAFDIRVDGASSTTMRFGLSLTRFDQTNIMAVQGAAAGIMRPVT